MSDGMTDAKQDKNWDPFEEVDKQQKAQWEEKKKLDTLGMTLPRGHAVRKTVKLDEKFLGLDKLVNEVSAVKPTGFELLVLTVSPDFHPTHEWAASFNERLHDANPEWLGKVIFLPNNTSLKVLPEDQARYFIDGLLEMPWIDEEHAKAMRAFIGIIKDDEIETLQRQKDIDPMSII